MLTLGMSSDITIMMPCFNEEAHIERKIVTLISAKLPPACIIILDDGSTDNTYAKISPFLSNSLRLLQHSSNLGLHAALKSLLSQTINTSYFALTTPSDIYCDTFFLAVSRAIRAFNPDFVFTQSFASESLNEYQPPSENVYDVPLLHVSRTAFQVPRFLLSVGLRFPSSNAVVYNKKHLSAARLLLANRGLECYIDIIFLAHLFAISQSIVFINSPMCYANIDQASYGKMLARRLSFRKVIYLIMMLSVRTNFGLIPFVIIAKHLTKDMLLRINSNKDCCI